MYTLSPKPQETTKGRPARENEAAPGQDMAPDEEGVREEVPTKRWTASNQTKSEEQSALNKRSKGIRARQQHNNEQRDPVLAYRSDYMRSAAKSRIVMRKSAQEAPLKAKHVVGTPMVRAMHDNALGSSMQDAPLLWTALLEPLDRMQNKDAVHYKEYLTTYLHDMFGAPGTSATASTFMLQYLRTLSEVRHEIRRPYNKKNSEQRTENLKLKQDMESNTLVLNANGFPAHLWGELRVAKLRALCSLMRYCATHGIFNISIKSKDGHIEPISGWSAVSFDEPFAWVWFLVWRELSDTTTKIKIREVALKTMMDEMRMRLWMQEKLPRKGCNIKMRARFDVADNSVWTAIFGAGVYKHNSKTPSKIAVRKEGAEDAHAQCCFEYSAKRRKLTVLGLAEDAF